MSTRFPNKRTLTTEAKLNACTIGGARRHDGPVNLTEYDHNWPALFQREAERIDSILGEIARQIEHVGSTSVPGLAAKPIIDIVLVVPDSSDEGAYVAPLEKAGYELRIREPDWWEHRVLKGPDTDINLHVFSHGCAEVDRMLRFRDLLRVSDGARKCYEDRKRELAARNWEYIQQYADAKTDVIEGILSNDELATG